MPVFEITLHTRGSWLADREEGFHEVGRRGTMRANPGLGAYQRSVLRGGERVCGPALQRLCVAGVVASAGPLSLLLFAVATSDTHLHLLLGWENRRDAEAVRRSLKRSLSLRLKEEAAVEPPLFSGLGNCFRVHQAEKLRRHRYAYLPDHPGWCWDPARGWRPPRRGGRLGERWRLGRWVEAGGFGEGAEPRWVRSRAAGEAAAAAAGEQVPRLEARGVRPREA